MIKENFDMEMPPRTFLEQVMDSASKAYCFLWDRKDKNNCVEMTWRQISQSYHKNNFKASVRKLNNCGLLSYVESDNGIHIELVGWDDIIV